MIYKHTYASGNHLCNLSDEALERELANETLRGFLILANLAESHSPRAVAMRLLYTSSSGIPGDLRGSGPASFFCSRNLTNRRAFVSCVVFSCSVLCARHEENEHMGKDGEELKGMPCTE